MRKLEGIVESTTTPESKNLLWIDNGTLKYYKNGQYETLSSSGDSSEAINNNLLIIDSSTLFQPNNTINETLYSAIKEHYNNFSNIFYMLEKEKKVLLPTNIIFRGLDTSNELCILTESSPSSIKSQIRISRDINGILVYDKYTDYDILHLEEVINNETNIDLSIFNTNDNIASLIKFNNAIALATVTHTKITDNSGNETNVAILTIRSLGDYQFITTLTCKASTGEIIDMSQSIGTVILDYNNVFVDDTHISGKAATIFNELYQAGIDTSVSESAHAYIRYKNMLFPVKITNNSGIMSIYIYSPFGGVFHIKYNSNGSGNREYTVTSGSINMFNNRCFPMQYMNSFEDFRNNLIECGLMMENNPA